jgi:hypothetical protein
MRKCSFTIAGNVTTVQITDGNQASRQTTDITMEYVATIQHHSISRACQIGIDGTLTQSKRVAAKEFAGELHDYTIVVGYEDEYGFVPVSRRAVSGGRWLDVPKS